MNGFARSAGQRQKQKQRQERAARWTKGKEADVVGEVSEERFLVGGTRKDL